MFGWKHIVFLNFCKIRGHRLNMELDLQSLFRLLCTAVLIVWDPATTLHPRIWAHIYEGACWSAKMDDISLSKFLSVLSDLAFFFLAHFLLLNSWFLLVQCSQIAARGALKYSQIWKKLKIFPGPAPCCFYRSLLLKSRLEQRCGSMRCPDIFFL